MLGLQATILQYYWVLGSPQSGVDPEPEALRLRTLTEAHLYGLYSSAFATASCSGWNIDSKMFDGVFNLAVEQSVSAVTSFSSPFFLSLIHI